MQPLKSIPQYQTTTDQWAVAAALRWGQSPLHTSYPPGTGLHPPWRHCWRLADWNSPLCWRLHLGHQSGAHCCSCLLAVDRTSWSTCITGQFGCQNKKNVICTITFHLELRLTIAQSITTLEYTTMWRYKIAWKQKMYKYFNMQALYGCYTSTCRLWMVVQSVFQHAGSEWLFNQYLYNRSTFLFLVWPPLGVAMLVHSLTMKSLWPMT